MFMLNKIFESESESESESKVGSSEVTYTNFSYHGVHI